MNESNEKFSKLIKIIPTYNEKNNIAALSRLIFNTVPEASLLVVDDNSPDGTAQLAMDMKKEFPRIDVHKRIGDRGFGKSYKDGFRKILDDNRYHFVAMMDADLSHDPSETPHMIKHLDDYDMVIGSRYVSGGSIKNWKPHRRILSHFANFYSKIILGLPIKDLTTGFMCFRKDILRKIDLDSIRSEGYAFLVEFKYRAVKAGLKIIEHPITFTERREGESKMSYKVIWESIWMPWKLRFFSKKYQK